VNETIFSFVLNNHFSITNKHNNCFYDTFRCYFSSIVPRIFRVRYPKICGTNTRGVVPIVGVFLP
jgi:hypothetical protein